MRGLFLVLIGLLISNCCYGQYNPDYDQERNNKVIIPKYSLGGGLSFGNFVDNYGPDSRLGFNINAIYHSIENLSWVANISRLSKDDNDAQFINWIMGLGLHYYPSRSKTSFYLTTGINYFFTNISFERNGFSDSDSKLDVNGGLGFELLVDNLSFFFEAKYLVSSSLVLGNGGIRFDL